MKDKLELLRNLAKAEYFSESRGYRGIVLEAKRMYKENKLIKCSEALALLPTEDQLLETLMKKLKGKSVYTTVKALSEGRVENKHRAMIAYSSLLTHILIEAEQGSKEYELLIEPTINQIYKML